MCHPLKILCVTLINIVLCRGWHTQVNDRFQNYKTFNCSLDFNLTHLLTESCHPPMFFGGGDFCFTDGLTISMLRVPQNMLRENIEFLSPWIFLEVVLFNCDCFVSSPSIGLTFIVHLKIITKKLKAGSVSKVKVVSANADTILVAINKRSNTNINEGN